jgi:hypothetical protein
MPKATIEFTPTSSFALVTPPPSSTELAASYRVLSEDSATGDKTVLLVHPPGQEWGGTGGKESKAEHVYWEVCYTPTFKCIFKPPVKPYRKC